MSGSVPKEELGLGPTPPLEALSEAPPMLESTAAYSEET